MASYRPLEQKANILPWFTMSSIIWTNYFSGPTSHHPYLPPLQYISILSPKPGPTCGFANATPLPYGPSHISSHSCQNAPVFLLSPLPTGSYLAIEALPLHFRSAACWLLLYRLSSCVIFPFHSRLPHQSASKGEPRLIHPSSTPVPSTVPDKRQALNKEERDDYRWPSWNQTDLYRLPGWCFSHYLGPF